MRLVLLLLFFLKFVAVSSQNVNQINDIVTATRYCVWGDSLMSIEQYDEAIQYFTKAKSIYQSALQWERVASCYNKQSKSYWRTARFEEASKSAESALSACLKAGLTDHLEEGLAYKNMASVAVLTGNVAGAESNFKKALNILEAINDKKELAPLYNAIGSFELRRNEYPKSLIYFQKAADASIEAYGETQPDLILIYNNIANTNALQGFYPEAEEFAGKALKVAKKQNKLYSSFGAQPYNVLGISSYKKGAYQQALLYFQKYLSLLRNFVTEDNFQLSYPYNNIGMIHSELGDTDKALEYFEKAYELRLNAFGDAHPLVAESLNNIAQVYAILEDYNTALGLLEKSVEIRKKVFGDMHLGMVDPLQNIGYSLGMQRNHKHSIEYFNKALAIYDHQKITKHPQLAELYNNIGTMYLNLHEYERAVEFFEKSFTANAVEPAINEQADVTIPKNFLSPLPLLHALNGKGIALRNIFSRADHNTEYLKRSLSCFEIADKFIEDQRKQLYDQKDKIELGIISHSIYEGAIEDCMLMFKANGDQQSLEKSFYFLERSKAGALIESLSAMSAKGMGRIPDKLLALERTIKKERAFYQTKIMDAQLNGDTLQIEVIKDKVFEVSRRSDSIELIFEREYPDYFALKYKKSVKTVRDVQRSLKPESAVIEYFEGDSSIFIFTITRNTFEVFTRQRDTVYQELLDHFRNCFMQTEVGGYQSAEAFDQFRRYSFGLYKLLVQQSIEKISVKEAPKELLIIPGGQLCYIPFDVLLTSNSSGAEGDYGSLKYLMSDYSITYGYSSALSFGNFDRKHRPADNNYLAFAPLYEGNNSDSTMELALGRFRDAITPLKWNVLEAQKIMEKLNGQSYLINEATEENFKAKAAGYNVIHLAMHALVDDKEPMNSKFIFYNDNDSIEDGYLHAFEIYDMELNAELVVLSACNTGYGKIARGEGIMSLARAFAYAGVPSMIMSMWKVDDESTSQLMELFYRNIGNGLTISEALRHAKLEYIRTAEPAKKHPFYWGAFVSIGDDRSIEQSHIRSIVLSGVAVAFILLMVYLYLRKRHTGKLSPTS